MTEREQIIAAQAKAFADDAIAGMEFLNVAEDEEIADYIEHGQLGPDDLGSIYDAAISHETYNPETHTAISKLRLEDLLEIEADAEYAALTAK